VGGPILGDVPNLEAARHERYSVLVGTTGGENSHADILCHDTPRVRNDTQSRSELRKIIRNLSPNTAI